jgi:hypothetical protein
MSADEEAMTGPLPFSGQGLRAVVLGILVWWLVRTGHTELANRVVSRL